MGAINENALAKFKGILEVRLAGTTGAFTRLASVRGLISNIDTTNVVDIKADDTGSVFKVVDVQATIEAELLENASRDVLNLLFTGTTNNTAGSLTPITNEAHGTGWTVGTPFRLNYKNGDNTLITPTSIKAGASTLVLDTDYKIYVGDGVNGLLGYTYIFPLTAQTLAITANYSYTPYTSEGIIINIDSTVVKSFEVKITATDNGKNRVITLSSAAFTSTYGLNFADVVEAGDITGATVTFTANKGSTLSYDNEII